MRRRILMVLYYYPPIGSIGMMRTLRIARHLPDLGWEPLILTVSEGTLAVISCDPAEGELDVGRVFRSRNPDIEFKLKSLLGFDVHQHVDAVRYAEAGAGLKLKARAARWAGDWNVPDRMVDWWPFARRTAIDICRTFSPSVLFSSSPPATCHLIAASTKKKVGLPWMADMRDPWTTKVNERRAALPMKLDGLLERRTLAAADAVSVISSPIAEQVRELLPGKPVHEIPNSFDEEAFAGVEPMDTGDLNLLHAGTITYPHRDPRPLFRALRTLEEEGRDITPLKLEFAGNDSDVVEGIAREEGVADHVRVLGLLPPREAVAREKGAQTLLYMQYEPEGHVTPAGKLFEYLGAGRPILAFAPTAGSIDGIMASSGAGQVVRNQQEIAGVLAGWLDEYQAKGSLSYGGSAEAVSRYSSLNMVKEFARVFEDLAAG
jgi:glycosyltransferase involved in cell wall biosynthesis